MDLQRRGNSADDEKCECTPEDKYKVKFSATAVQCRNIHDRTTQVKAATSLGEGMVQLRGLAQQEIRSQNLRGPKSGGKPEQIAHGEAKVHFHKAAAKSAAAKTKNNRHIYYMSFFDRYEADLHTETFSVVGILLVKTTTTRRTKTVQIKSRKRIFLERSQSHKTRKRPFG